MKHRIVSSIVALAFGAVVSSAWAGEGCGKGDTPCGKACPHAKAEGAAQGNQGGCCGDCGGCCGQGVTSGDSKLACSQGCDKAKCGGCCGQGVTSGDSKSACSQSCDKAKCGGCPRTAEFTGISGGVHGDSAKSILAALPKVQYRVGDKTVFCAKKAGAIAEQSGQRLQYVVGSSLFDNKADAVGHLTTLLEQEVELLKTVQYGVNGSVYNCPKAASAAAEQANTTVAYRVGGFDFTDQAQAEKAMTLVSEKLAGVKVSYRVGDDSFCCSKGAGLAAQKSGEKIRYTVGDEETTCEETSRLMLVKAMIETIVQTVEAVSTS